MFISFKDQVLKKWNLVTLGLLKQPTNSLRHLQGGVETEKMSLDTSNCYPKMTTDLKEIYPKKIT